MMMVTESDFPINGNNIGYSERNSLLTEKEIGLGSDATNLYD